ncbi:MAG: sensor histidine kinase, partial [Acidimicrobiia bacterium]
AMTQSLTPWERRARRVVIGIQWSTLAVGVFVGVVVSRASPVSLAAAGLAALYVLGFAALPERLIQRSLAQDGLTLMGIFLTLGAAGLTGTTDSPYLLLSLTPVIHAAFFGGFRIGAAAATLSAGLLVALTMVEELPFTPAVQWIALYYVVGMTFAQARRLLVETHLRAEALEAAGAATTQQLERLQSAHDLLNRLSEITHTSEINPISVGSAALDALIEAFPNSAALAALAGDHGPVVLARRGEAAPKAVRTMFPLAVGDREVGLVVLSTHDEPTPEQRAEIQEGLRPLSLAFSNIMLLQEIARTAIREERTRLARELHDEIGPSLASLGLALDLAVLQHPTEPALAAHLEDLRRNVGRLVEEVRTTVADLREPPQATLSDTLSQVLAGLPAGPEIVVKVEERRPPRPSIGPDVLAIVTEAVRNAHRHAAAATIRVTGVVDFDSGRLAVMDDGGGFDTSQLPGGHYGIIGMRERADRIGGAVEVISDRGGTTVTLRWGRS